MKLQVHGSLKVNLQIQSHKTTIYPNLPYKVRY